MTPDAPTWRALAGITLGLAGLLLAVAEWRASWRMPR